VLAGLTYALARRAPLVLMAVGVPVTLVVAPMRALFPEGGYEPYPATSFVATALVAGALLWALPHGGNHRRVLRVGAVGYLLACALCLVVHTPMGSNVERYGVLLAGPLLLCGLARDGLGGGETVGDGLTGDGHVGAWAETRTLGSGSGE